MTFDRKQRTLEISAEQLASIRDAVRLLSSASDEKEADEKEAAESASEPAVLFHLSHLSDAQFVLLCMEASVDQLGEESRAHLEQCPECRAEWHRLQDLGAVWKDSAATAQLEARLPALQKVGVGIVPVALRRLVSLSALLPAQAEWAAQSVPAPVSVGFPVCEEDHPVPGLTGALQRRNHEFYALITPLDAEATARYRERSVVLTITDEENQPPILTREIGVGVAVLLGTNLPLTLTSVVHAVLLPSS